MGSDGRVPAGEPPSVAFIRGAAGWLKRHRLRVLAAALAAGLALWLTTGLYTVGNGESGALRRFGRLVDDAIGPGLHVSLPAGVDEMTKVRTGEVLRREVAGDFGEPLALVTGDENLIETTLVVQYKITSLGPYLFRSEDPSAFLEQAVRAALVDAVVRMPVDDVLTSGKAKIQNEVRRSAQAMLQTYGTGLSLVAVNLQTVTPPSEAADAFHQVSDARAEAARMINEAESRRGRMVNLARGEAAGLVGQASSWAAARIQKARGAAERFERLLVQERRTPEQTRTDFYLETLRKALPRTRIIVLPRGARPRVDVNLMPSRDPTP
ncbi:MAG TPA: FtsH protease activity modulator HflK [Thermoanaerobaculia bacterium]|jgi:membrane protease subunit HflK|nr:FtsH protease activity modulator HflK [Thermoanaerobaculia bacterium]